MIRRIYICIVMSLLACLSCGAVTYAEAKDMYRAGDYAGALPVFQKRLKDRPKDAALNHWVGVCLMQTGRPHEAVPYLEFAHKKKITSSPRYLAEIAFMDYRIDDAVKYIDAYREALDKDDKEMSEDDGLLAGRIGRMRSMLDRVEAIEIIDSVAVEPEEFFRHYRLTIESGSLNSRSVLPDVFDAVPGMPVYMPESRQSMIWAMSDSAENYVLVGSNLLSDGTWERPHVLGGNLNEGGDANYPFLMSDGITLYFANDGENSLGGYDIFISRRDDDGFLQPQNIGMPYNSPYNDYMLAIDEITGVGWWATDRNRTDGLITIYKFIPKEMRVNYPVDKPDLGSLARVDSYRDTWAAGADYSDILSSIAEIDPLRKVKKHDFRFAMPGGKIYTSWDDFQNPDARVAMQGYVDACAQHDDDKNALAELRRQYADGDESCSAEILSLEAAVRKARLALRRMANDVIKLETR